MTAPDSPASPRPPAGWRVILPVALGIAAAPLDSSVNISMPDITAHFAVPVHAIQWVVIAYVLTYSCLLLGFGRLADTVGHRKVFIAGLWVSMVALAGCALAQTFEQLLLARVAQGFGSAMVLSVGPALMTLSFPPEQRPRLVAHYAFAFALGYAIGPFIGGVLVEHWGWPSIFAYRVPVLGVAWLLTLTVMPPIRLPGPDEKFDARANLALAAGVFLVLLFVNQTAHRGAVAWWLFIVGAGGLAALTWFVRSERRAAQPVLDLGLFAHFHFTAVNVAHTLVNGAIFMIMLFGPFYVTRATGGNEIIAGLFLGMFPLGIALSSLAGSALLKTLGGLWLSRGSLGVVALGLWSIASWPAEPAYWHLALTLLLPGLGYGLFQVASLDLVMGTMSRAQQGVAGSLNTVTRTVGVVLGASLGSWVFAQASRRYGEGPHFDIAFEQVFAGATVVAALSFGLFALVRRPAPAAEDSQV